MNLATLRAGFAGGQTGRARQPSLRGAVWPRSLSRPGTATSVEYLEARQRWLRVLRKDATSELARRQLAENELSLGNTRAAARWVRELAGLPALSEPNHVHELEARIALERGDVERALGHWRDAVVAGSDEPGAMYSMVNRFLARNDVASARACRAAVSESVSEAELGRLVLAKCHVQERRWSEAIALLEDLDRFDRHRKLATDLLYRCYMNDFRHDSAALLCAALDAGAHPDRPYLLGKVRYRQLRFADAIAAFSEAIDTHDHPDSKVWLVRTLYAINEHDDAIAKAELVDAMQGVDPLIGGRCWEAAGLLSRAEAHYREAAENRGDPALWRALIEFQMTYRFWGRAWASLAGARARGIGYPEMWATRERLLAAFTAAGTRVPKSADALARFEFRSSETMVSTIVDRLLASPPPPAMRRTRAAGEGERIVLVINSLGPGGAERQAVNLANGLVADDSTDDVRVICTYLSRLEQDCFYLPQVDARVTVSEYYSRAETLSVADVPALAAHADLIVNMQPPSRQQLILHMARKLDALSPDVVHGWLDETFINTALVCRMLGIETVVGRWGSMPPGVNRTVTERDLNNIEYLQHAYRAVARLPRLRYSSNSRLTGDAYAELMGIDAGEVAIVYNGIDEDRLERDRLESPDLRAELGIPAGAKIVGTVFRVSEEKRPMLWIDVATRLAATDPDMHFVVVGAGPLHYPMMERASAAALGNIHFVGKQTNVGAWFSLFDVFLLTSSVEGVSNAVIEAQFCGTPVVAPEVGGMSEAMSDGVTGQLLSDHSAEAFARAVSRIVEQPALLASLGEGARAFARDKFSVPTMVGAYRQLFLDSVDSGASRR